VAGGGRHVFVERRGFAARVRRKPSASATFALDELQFADAWIGGDASAREVRDAGSEALRFAAVYAAADVVTTYREPVQPDGRRERRPVS
jgi:hypothetical protein